MKRNAFFQLVHKEDGIYLKSYPALNGGAPLTAEDVVLYLDKKKIADINLDDIVAFVGMAAEDQNAEVKIMSGKMLPEKEFPIITIDKKRTFAKIRLYPPSSEGGRLTFADLRALVEQNGIKHGIIDQNLKILLKGRLYCTDILIAKATPPVQGHDASITYHFDVDKTCKPAMDEDGTVDFHKLDMIEPVSEGQLLATLDPADFGTPGIDVMGGKMKPKKVKALTLKHGKNIHLSEDKLEMYSDVSGNVTVVDSTVFVSNQYEVPADVGPSTGDIEYDGSVLVKGNVLTGYTIKATGDITVNGVVEGATLISDGKIVLKRGVQGMGKAELTAQGDVISNFIESAAVTTESGIMTDAIMHSEIVAKDDIIVKGKRGLIAGGSVRTKTRIDAKTIGSTMGTATAVEVGIDPKVTERYHAIEKEMEKLANEKDNLLQSLKILKKRLETKGKLDDEKMKSLKNTTERIKEIEAQMEADSEEYDALGEELGENTNGRIVVDNVVYPGVTMTIASITKHIKKEMPRSAFVRDGADIKMRTI